MELGIVLDYSLMRRVIVAGNWKMHKTLPEAVDFVRRLAPRLGEGQADVWLASSYTALAVAAQAAIGSPILVGAQNISDQPDGAFTGEVSLSQLEDVGARFALIGHSERRHVFGESDALIASKMRHALTGSLTPLLCIGETLQDRQDNRTEAVLEQQLSTALESVDVSRCVVAYEPVWAIGTGHSATPEQAQETHAFCRTLLGADVSILYGGSVKPDNAAALMSQPDIDGVLVGGASLDLESFLSIIQESHQP